jgi:CBS domain-containing protein
MRKEVSMGARARDVMTGGVEWVAQTESVADAARKLADLNVGSMPICGENARLKGMLTDRDIVVKVVAQGRDPAATMVGELAQGTLVTIGADDSIDAAMETMIEHRVRRLPVLDGEDLVGIISQADIARHLSDEKTGRLVEAISLAP